MSAKKKRRAPASSATTKSAEATKAAESPEQARRDVPPGTTLGTKVSVAVGIIAAMVVALLVNVAVARHYKRWDLTTGGLYTLSDPTKETLRALRTPVKIYVLLPSGTPLQVSVQELLESYRGETSSLAIEYVDPDARPAQMLALQHKYDALADHDGGQTDGSFATGAAILIVHGERPYYIATRDLVQADDEDETKARPRIEEALTTGIRAVVDDKKPRACFTIGHGEKPDLAPLKERLKRNNFELDDVPPALGGSESPLARCTILIVAAPSERVSDEDVARYRGFVQRGGSALVVAGPLPDGAMRRFRRLNLADLMAVGGVKMNDDFVFELSPKHRVPRDFGEVFLPTPKPHPVSDPIAILTSRGAPTVITIASSLESLGGAVAPAPLLVTTDQSFGMLDFFRWGNESAPLPKDGDHKGPLTIAFASELPKTSDAVAHGPRMIVVGSASVLSGENWQKEELRANAAFVESSIGWLAARPALVHVPEKPAFTAGLRLSDDDLAAVLRYVVFFLPLASALLGAAVFLRRRNSERVGKRPEANAS
jgi:hypothetical protein